MIFCKVVSADITRFSYLELPSLLAADPRPDWANMLVKRKNTFAVGYRSTFEGPLVAVNGKLLSLERSTATRGQYVYNSNTSSRHVHTLRLLHM